MSTVLAFLCVGLITFTGCKGTPIKSEKEARAQLAAESVSYRPDGHRPELPLLSTNSTMADLLQFALLNQPKVEAAYYDWAASIEAITSARSKPDPQLTFQMDIQDIVTSVMPGFMASFPGPGKLRASGEVTAAQSQGRYFTFKAASLESAFEVKRALYQLHFLDERIRVGQATAQLLGELAQIASAQNEVGRGTLQDILRAQIEQDRLTTELTNNEDSRRVFVAQYKAALGLRADQEDPPVPSRVEFTRFETSPEELMAAVLTNNTRLHSMAAEVRAAEAAIVVANKGRVPDFSVGLMADAKMSPVLYRPLATVSLPIWRDKIAAQIAQAQLAKKAAEARLSAEQITLAVDIAERLFQIRQATRALDLLERDLLPKSRQSLEVARSGYLSGQIDFFNLIDSERTLLGLELSAVEARTQRELVVAELALLAEGMPVSSSGSAGMPSTGAGAVSGGTSSMGSPKPMRSSSAPPMNSNSGSPASATPAGKPMQGGM